MDESKKKHFLKLLCRHGRRMEMGKNQYFSSINNHENTAYCLVSGVCALSRFTQGGEEIIYHYFKESDFIGGVPLFLSHENAAQAYSHYNFCSLYTKTECVLYQIPFSVVEQLIREDPEISFWIGECVARYFMASISHVHSSRENHVSGCLCRALIELADHKSGRYELKKYFTYAELSRYLGVHQVTVSKVMLQLKKEGIIEKEGHKTIIRDMERLRKLAEAGYWEKRQSRSERDF